MSRGGRKRESLRRFTVSAVLPLLAAPTDATTNTLYNTLSPLAARCRLLRRRERQRERRERERLAYL